MGWEQKHEPDDDPDLTDWLEVHGVAIDGADTRVYDVHLEVEDALRIAPWLRAVAGSASSPGAGLLEDELLTFLEPGFAVPFVSCDALIVITDWCFYDPVGRVLERLTFRGRVIRIASSGADVLSCAAAWADELAPFVPG